MAKRTKASNPAAVQNFDNLGLSPQDIAQLQRYNLTYMLDKIKKQQDEYEIQTLRLKNAFQNMEKNLSAAREAQLSLLPRGLGGVPQINFCGRFLPSQYVSGDIYNVFRLDENHVGLYHIDISGHGVTAALFSISLSHTLSTTVSSRSLLKTRSDAPPFYQISTPVEVIKALDDDRYYEQFGIYFTMIYMVINLKEHVINYCRAGHNPPVVIRKNGDTDIFEEGSLPIGWGFPRDDKLGTIVYQPGDVLFLYSDGITDAQDPSGNTFGQNQLLHSLRSNRDKRICYNLDRLLKNLQKFHGSVNYEDDISIIGIEFKK